MPNRMYPVPPWIFIFGRIEFLVSTGHLGTGWETCRVFLGERRFDDCTAEARDPYLCESSRMAGGCMTMVGTP
jgi:hypothetical protein